ncbi:putative chaperone-like ATPase (ISS) [Trypanosoma grayi]|uniref:putative chaperone-like ATPase (ISS) n=1 Tax=Trypanosoma grayi TaxID=71804 RepID=UPI0004F4B980|nr:putative chaperone-like ATPase (ISS) [Trypanosoma grayi]KEG10823.1 putative chaperone-like ATPase (ISS) [Trypanosoma grayi]
MVVKSSAPSPQSETKHVTFGSVTIVHVPRRRTCSSSSSTSNSLPATDNSVSVDLNLLVSPHVGSEVGHATPEEAREWHTALVASQGSDCSLLLTQAALCSSYDESGDGSCDDREDEHALPAAGTPAVFSPLQLSCPWSSSSQSTQVASPVSCHGSGLASASVEEHEVLGGTPLSASSDTSFALINADREKEEVEEEEEEADATAAARNVRRRVEVCKAASTATCVFCHVSREPLECYEGHYLHLACALWCPEVYYDTEATTLRNINAVLERCRLIKCVHCRRPGAPVGCVNERCQRSYHLHCAVEAGVTLNEKTFEMLCPKHSSKRNQL